MIKNYIKTAWRGLVRNKAFSLINIIGLAVGMTACFIIYIYVSFELSYDNFHSKADRIYRIVADVKTPSETITTQGLTSAPVAINLKRDFPEIEEAVRLARDEYLVRKGDVFFQEKRTVLADSALFGVFDFPLVSGDRKTALKEPMSIVISQTTAKKYFGNADPLGQHLLLTGAAIPSTITGVMKDLPENSQIKADLFVSMSSFKQIYGAPTADSEWTNHGFYTYLQLTPGTDPEKLALKFPGFMEFHHGKQAKELQMQDYLSLEPLHDVYLRSKRDGFVSGNINNVYIFSVIAVFILLIACVNFINLTTARSAERAKEVGIRKVAGAGRAQLARQFMGESVMISLMSFLFSLLLSTLLLPVFNQLAGKTIGATAFFNPWRIFQLFLLSVGVGVAAGMYPSFVLSSFKPVNVLKGQQATGTQRLLLRKGLVVFQFVISIVLIVGTIVVYTQLKYMRNQQLGFNREQTIFINTNFDKNKDAFKQSLATVRGVVSSCYSAFIPGGGNTSAYSELENKSGEMQKTNMDLNFIDFDYVRQYQLRLVAGRGLSADLGTDSTQAMLINETAARSLGYTVPKEAVGKNFSQWGSKGTIVGVLKDFHYQSLQQQIKPLTMRYDKGAFTIISIKLSPENIKETIRGIEHRWRQAIPNRPFEYAFLDKFFDEQYHAEDRFGDLFFNFALLAVFISCLGLLGLSLYSTLQRTKEIGVRKVLGAGVSNIVMLLSAGFLKLVLIAFLIALPVAWLGMNKWLGAFAYRVNIAWWMFASAGLAAVLVAFLTISFQAIKAALANPVKALRSE
ncbi:ABC transporter permease [Niabella beijingensis]|uniref:ABC transporter permease n=1 Tax=Niabella beijingensis TaxID=2872700 RepID=UPI001CBE8D47|nr:ABC transporter permease [Niabella beijingensis]MBZ4191472.1 ABC transporter permease [Niabella beijingensis]